MENKNEITNAASTLGKISTPKKAKAARANGKKGGRPPLTAWYEVGERESCGHKHRTLESAKKCARQWANSQRRELIVEAEERGQTWAQYLAEFCKVQIFKKQK